MGVLDVNRNQDLLIASIILLVLIIICIIAIILKLYKDNAERLANRKT